MSAPGLAIEGFVPGKEAFYKILDGAVVWVALGTDVSTWSPIRSVRPLNPPGLQMGEQSTQVTELPGHQEGHLPGHPYEPTLRSGGMSEAGKVFPGESQHKLGSWEAARARTALRSGWRVGRLQRRARPVAFPLRAAGRTQPGLRRLSLSPWRFLRDRQRLGSQGCSQSPPPPGPSAASPRPPDGGWHLRSLPRKLPGSTTQHRAPAAAPLPQTRATDSSGGPVLQ